DLVSPAYIGLGVFHLLMLGHALAHFQLVQTRPEHLHGFGAVAVLRSVVLALDDDAGGHVRDAHGGIGLVDVLAARAAGPVGVDPQVGGVDVDLDRFIDFGVDEHTGEGGVPAVGGIEGAFAHQPVHARFRTQE